MAQEKNFENRLKKFLEDEGCWFVKFFANSFTKSGIPDILVCCNGYFVAVEVKAPNGKPSELQKWNIEKIYESGGIGVVLYPDQYGDFIDLISYLKEGQEMNARRVAAKINERWRAKKCR